MANDKVKISLPVVPEIDRRAARSVTSEIRDLERQLGPIKVSFSELAKMASSSVKELNKVASTASAMGKNIGQAVKQARDEIGALDKSLKGARPRRGRGGRGADDKDDTRKSLVDTTDDLNNAMSSLLKSTRSQVDASKRAAKAQADLAKAMKLRRQEKLEGFSGIMKDLPNLFKKGSMGSGIKGIGGGLGKIFGVTPHGPTAGAKAVASAGGGGAAAGGAMGSAASALMKAGPYIAAAAAAIMAIAKILQMASESQVKINKAMLDGVGFANDFGVSVQGYRDGIDELRDAIQDTSYVMLKFGGNSEQTAKIINRFTKESTGSLMQTRNQLSQMPGGLEAGVASLAKASIAYGKALGMEAEEAAAMMGRFTNELGMSAQGSMDAMANIVKAASLSNMPMTKFMEIFHKVIPDVELYQNRLEELTGTVKLLSKTMSAKDVKNFMDAFANGFKGTDFRQRLKTTLVTGTATVSQALEKDFEAKARAMAKNFAEYGVNEDEFVAAMKGGERSMAALINRAQAVASHRGQQLQGAQISDAMKLAGYEATRQKGGSLNVATAMSGAGLMATYKILSKYGQTLTTGFDGLSEHVMKQLGISEQQYEALRTTAQSLKVQRDMLRTYGETNSKSMNEALRETVKLRKQGMTEAEIEEAMRNATDEELFAAAERQQAILKDQEKAFNLAEEQYNVTTSIGDKLDNVIAFLLEQVLRVLNPMLDVLNDILMWTMGGDKKQMLATQSMADDIKFANRDKAKDKQGKSTGMNETVDAISDAIGKGLASGKTGKDLASAVAKSGAFDAESLKSFSDKDIIDLAQRTGGSSKDIFSKMRGARERGDVEGMLKALDELPGDMSKNLMEMTKLMVERGITTQAGRDKAAGIQTSRPGAKKSMTAQQRAAAIQAGQASDIKALGRPLPPSAVGGPSPASVVSTTQIDKPRSTEAKNDAAAVQETAKATAEHSRTAEQQLRVQEAERAATDDMASILKKGIHYDQGWMGTKYKNVLKEATLDSFRTALAEFLVLEQKVRTDPKFAEALAGAQGWNFAAGGAGAIGAALSAVKGGVYDKLHDSGIGGFATGGSVDYDQLAKVHKGEFVVPKGGVLVKGGEGGKTVNVNATINVHTDADPKQIAAEVHNLYRAH